VLGHAFGPNPERGVYRTRDGGKTWQQVLKKDADTGASDVALDPNNPNILFAGFWQARRRPWELTSGGPGSGLWTSRDGGDSWQQLAGNGLPGGVWGKIGIAVAPSDGRRVYALIEAEEGGLFRSDDGGESWSRATADRRLRQRAWYYSTLTVNPKNPDEVWLPQVPLLKSLDGGKTVQFVRGTSHGDHHDVWIDPEDPQRLIVAHDGGVDISTDGGESWLAPPLPLGQFYHVSADTRTPFRIAGAMQDIGTAQAPSNTYSGSGIRNGDWYGVGGGEAGWVVSDPAEPDFVYAGEYLGYLSRYDHRTRQAKNVSAWPDNPSGWAGEQMRYRFQWTAPIAVSPHPPHAVYHGANVLFRSRDRGETWEAISSDLTRNDKSKQKWSGGPITGDNTGVETYCTIFAVAESPVTPGVIWTGSDDGLVHVSRDDGKSWQNVTAAIPGLPEWATVRMIEPSRFDAGTAYVVADAHRLDDMRPYLWRTRDYGKSWQRLDRGLARDVYLHAVREDPGRRGVLVVGTERGVAVSLDDGATWRALRLNLPTVAVHDLAIRDGSLVAGTHGRSIWVLDDFAAIRDAGLVPAAKRGKLQLLPPAETVRRLYQGEWTEGWTGSNPAQGAALYYWLKEAPKEGEEVEIEILDAQDRLVRTLSTRPLPVTGSSEYGEFEKEELEKLALPRKAGWQKAVWDFGWSGAEFLPGAILDSGYPVFGPAAVPGDYRVRLKALGETATVPLRLLPDPASRVTPAQLEEQLRFGLEVRDAITRLTRTAQRLQAVRRQLAERNGLLRDEAPAAALRERSQKLAERLDALEARLHNPKAQVSYDILAMRGGAALYSRFSPFFDWIKDGDGAPTQGGRQVFAALSAGLDTAVSDLDALLAEVEPLNHDAERLLLPRIYLPSNSR
jgi:photosystem II stability/assembly factor-like uncharacterized protein